MKKLTPARGGAWEKKIDHRRPIQELLDTGDWEDDPAEVAVELPGKLQDTQDAMSKFGLPQHIYKHYHSCTCSDAAIAAATEVQPDGYIYADYQCDSGWSNLFRFKVRTKKKSKGKGEMPMNVTYKPKCPNHACEMDKTNERSIWICPISGARFEVEVDTNEKKIKFDKAGNVIEQYVLTPLDGDNG